MLLPCFLSKAITPSVWEKSCFSRRISLQERDLWGGLGVDGGDLEEIGINAGNWVDSAQGRNYWRALCECGIGPPGSISHGVS